MTISSGHSGRERLRLRITLLDSEPEIWRTLDVDSALRLDELHDAIQIAMGWRDTHLHEFSELDPVRTTHGLPQIGRPRRRWMPEEQLDDASDGVAYSGFAQQLIDEHGADVASVFELFDGPLYYWYDFGDDWMHRIDLIEPERVDGQGASMPSWSRRVELVAGERRGPLEDSGGPHGYANVLEALAYPGSPQHAEATAWAADSAWPATSVDPDEFDRDGIDRELELRFDEVAGDMSGLRLGAADAVDEAAPIVDLLERMPPSLRSEMRRRLRSAGALEPVRIDADAASRMVRPFAWLCERVGADGLTLSKAGWMPPSVVHEGMTELGWINDWVGASNREENTWPMRTLREAARRYGLLRVAKGRLLRSTAGNRLYDDPVGLWRHLAVSTLERVRSDAEQTATVLFAVELACGASGDLRQLGGVIARGLGALGWRQPDGDPLEVQDGAGLVFETVRVLGELGVFEAGSSGQERSLRSAIDPTPEGRAFARAMLGVR
ncbi:MAG: hypothetical protein QOH55_786 [Microbacteriaceae bacterium]|nr:hypothetical protein [Microbacteriaceae bacterium]